MSKIPLKMRQEMNVKSFYHRCARAELLNDHVCQPNPMNGQLIEWEHALIFGSNQVQKEYAIVPLCWYVHSGPGMNKEINVWIALNRATSEELRSISKAIDYVALRDRLNKKYQAVESSFFNRESFLGDIIF